MRESWSTVLLPLALIAGLVLMLSLNVGREGTVPSGPPETQLQRMVGYVASGAEIAAALVIGVAVLRGIAVYLSKSLGRPGLRAEGVESIRLGLGRVLALGLDFTIASDILRTTVAPTRQEIMNLGAIVLLRTLLNYFLELEIRMGEERSITQIQRGSV